MAIICTLKHHIEMRVTLPELHHLNIQQQMVAASVSGTICMVEVWGLYLFILKRTTRWRQNLYGCRRETWETVG